jgi:hypothetical protein
MRKPSCSADISSEKNPATNFWWIVRYAAMFSAKAVLPIPGRAATTMRSAFWKPCVSAFRRVKPVGRPVSIVPRPWMAWISTSFFSAIVESFTKPPLIEPFAISTRSRWAFSRTVSASGAVTASRIARRDWKMTSRLSEDSRTRRA